jgi:ElaB/YqjD/DUF883 family membrane-anchored ribosome-binding protein
MDERNQSMVAEPRTVDEARSVVEQSRQRISHTLDALEDRIVEKKQALQDKADVLRPVREQVEQRPFTAVAVAIGVGALLGSLSGGGEDDRGSRSSRKRNGKREQETSLSEEDRAELREWRAHRRERLQSLHRESESAREDHGPSRLDSMKNQLMGAVTSAIGAAVTAKVKSFTEAPRTQDTQSTMRDDGRSPMR